MIECFPHDWNAIVSFVGKLNEGEVQSSAGAVSLATVLVSVFAIN